MIFSFDPKIKSYLDRLAESKSRPSSYIFVGANIESKPSSAEASTVDKSLADKLADKNEAAFYFFSKIAGRSSDRDFLEKVQAGLHPDILIIEPEVEEKKGKTREKEISISQIREALERLKFFPYELEKKACIIKRAQKMNAEASNALLKSLEEPSERAVFILLSENIDSILPTIVSRCALLRFPEIKMPEWKEENREKFRSILKEEIFERFEYVEKVSKNKQEFVSVLKDWELVMGETLRKLVGSKDNRGKMRKVIEFIEITREAINRLERTNSSARSVGEELVLNF